jgi:hypothetical protein
MEATKHLLAHARSALDRSAMLLAEMQQNICSSQSTMGPKRHEAATKTVLELARRYRLLVEAFNGMDGATREELPAGWRRFFSRYDEYLEAIRDAKCSLAREEYWETLSTAAAAVVSDLPQAPVESFH